MTATTCTTCNRPADDGYVNEAARECCVDPCHEVAGYRVTPSAHANSHTWLVERRHPSGDFWMAEGSYYTYEKAAADRDRLAAAAAGSDLERFVDPRYTAEAIAGYSDAELASHLEERTAQRNRCKRDMTSAHAKLERLDDPDTATYRDTLADLGSYTAEHATLNRVIRHLEREDAVRKLAAVEAETADGRSPNIALLDSAIAKLGLPCGIEETGDTSVARQLWMTATLALEVESDGDDDRPTNSEVAARVADAYGIIYGYLVADHGPSAATREAAKRDAEELGSRLDAIDASNAYDCDVVRARRHARHLADALAVVITDPRNRAGLDPKAIAQARTALGLDHEQRAF